ncbi:uncharacterized protein LOC143557144 [Bidens hawaiensis]|uniref:uncharacterized protein LOC143557144 n=1 Tax=Bidens hawaiensis TaxID=980011 RepID=UPI004049AE77
MPRVEQRLDQVVDQLTDRIADLLNCRRLAPKNREGRDFDNPFYGNDDSSSEEGFGREPRREHGDGNRRWDAGIQTDIPEFDGTSLDPEGFNDWLATIEEVFEFREVLENKRVPLIATRLRGRASAWWQQLKLTRNRLGKSRIVTWAKMKKCLRTINLKQGSRSVDEYTTEFYHLVTLNDFQETDEQLVSRYIGGLRRHLFVEYEDEQYEEYEKAPKYDEEPEYVEEIVTGDAGVNLVLKRSCYTPKADGDEWLKHNIFHSTCTIMGKVCTFDIDSRSCDSLNSEEAVQKETGARGVEIPEAVIPLHEEFSDVFPDELPDGLPPLRDTQHHIDLEPSSQLPNRPHYRMCPREHEELHRQVEELISMGHVHESMSPMFPIPRLDDLLDQISGATIFTKLDLKSGYYQIRLRPGDEWKFAFNTREWLYEWLVMPFGLSNAPSTFMRVMNQLLMPFIGKFVVVYLNDILIYSASFGGLVVHARKVLALLHKDNFYAATKKCVFMPPKVLFLGYVIYGDGIQVDESIVIVV